MSEANAMRKLHQSIHVIVVWSLLIYVSANWWLLSQFATSSASYSAAWGHNGTANLVHVIVRDRQGQPLAGREVEVVNASGGTHAATTDVSGTVRIQCAEGELTALFIANVPIIAHFGPRFLRGALDLSNGLDVWVTERSSPPNTSTNKQGAH